MLKKLVLGFCPVGHSRSPFDLVFDKEIDMRDAINKDGVIDTQVDAVIFWGGTDINPAIYGQEPHPLNQASRQGLSSRDAFELQVMTLCKRMGIPMIGVCRGAQLMCAFAGGTLIQHVTGHGQDHEIEVETFPNVFKRVVTTSSHHQMMNPEGTNHKVIGKTWGPANRSLCYQGQTKDEEIESMKEQPEPEIVWFPDIKGLAIQGHPEWVDNNHPFADVCNTLVRQYLLTEEHAAA